MTRGQSLPRLAAEIDALAREWTREWRITVDRMLAPAGLHQHSWLTLVWLHEEGASPTQTDIAARLGTDDATVVRILDQLEKLGFVVRASDERDRRRKVITCTPAGGACVESLRSAITERRNELFAGVSVADLETSIATLKRVRANQKESAR